MVLLPDHEPIAAAASDPVSADDVVAPPDGGTVESEIDADLVSVNDDVSGNAVAPSVLDGDSGRTSMDVVSGDHVSVAQFNVDAGTVSNAPVTSHPIAVRNHEDSEVGVAHDAVVPDQVVG